MRPLRVALAPPIVLWQDNMIWHLRYLSMDEFRKPLDSVTDFYVGLHRALDRLMKANGASLARTKLLLYIKRGEAVRSTDIAEAFGHAPRTITEAIDGLERDGLVRRDLDPQDRRAKHISVTPAGMAAVEASEPVRARFMADVFTALDQGERETLAVLFSKLNQRLALLEQVNSSVASSG